MLLVFFFSLFSIWALLPVLTNTHKYRTKNINNILTITQFIIKIYIYIIQFPFSFSFLQIHKISIADYFFNSLSGLLNKKISPRKRLLNTSIGPSILISWRRCNYDKGFFASKFKHAFILTFLRIKCFRLAFYLFLFSFCSIE